MTETDFNLTPPPSPCIYVAAFTIPDLDKVIGFAVAEDGVELVVGQFPDIPICRLRLTGPSEDVRDYYDTHYPHGYQLIWVEQPETNPAWLAVCELSRVRADQKKDGKTIFLFGPSVVSQEVR